MLVLPKDEGVRGQTIEVQEMVELKMEKERVEKRLGDVLKIEGSSVIH